jgi:polyferredoxin
VCPEPQVIRYDEMGTKGFIDDGQCLNCARCLEVCPRGAFSFATRWGKASVDVNQPDGAKGGGYARQG